MSDAPQLKEQDPSLGGVPLDQAARVVVVDAPAVLTTEDVVEDLKRQLAEKATAETAKDAELATAREQREAEARGRQAADARARDAEAQARQAAQGGQRAVDEANLAAVKNALESNKGMMINLKTSYATAMQEGDFSKGADIQAEMATVGARLVQLEDGQGQLEERIKTPPPADQGRAPAADPAQARENFIMGQPPRVQDWLRSEKGARYFSDESFRARVMSAANYAQNGRRLDVGSQEYIDFIETEVGLRQATPTPPPPNPNPAPAPAGRDADDRRMVTAPAGGSTAGSVRSQPDGSTTVYLTQDERDMARRMGVSETEWAREKAAALREGQIGPNARNR